MPRPTPAVPTDLQELSGRFEDWRRTRRGKLPIPESLWAAAAELADRTECSVRHRCCDSTTTNSSSDGRGAGGKPVRPTCAGAGTFVELAPPTAAAECVIELEGPRGKHAHPVERGHSAGPGRTQPCVLWESALIQITPQMRVLVAIEPVDGRKGIDSLARLCQEKLAADPFSGCLFVFRSRSGTSIRILAYDGQGFWLAQKRLSKGRFVWWPNGDEPARALEAHQAQLLLAAGNPETEAAPVWRRVNAEEFATKDLRSRFRFWHTAADAGRRGAIGAEEITSEKTSFHTRAHRAHPDQSRRKLSRQAVRSLAVEAGQRRVARHGVPRPAADAGPGRPDRVAAGALTCAHNPLARRARPAAGADRHDADRRPLSELQPLEFSRCGAPPTSRCSTA